MQSPSKSPSFAGRGASLVAGAALVLVALGINAACGDEEAIVRDRLPGSGDGGGDGAAEGGPSCGLALTDTYVSGNFETNAAEELRLRKAFDDFLAPMRTVEVQAVDGGTPSPVTRAQLDTLWTTGTPSVKATTTTYYQGRVTGWLTAYETALTSGPYTPGVPDAGDRGGLFGGLVFDPTGIDLRQAIEKGSIPAAFYNQAQSIVSAGAITVGTIDRLIAAFGAHPSFQNNPDATQYRDVHAAANAARRDSKDAANPGPYQKIRRAMIVAKAAVEAGDRCTAERDAALATFLREWERSNYATAVHALSVVNATLAAGPATAVAYRNLAEAIGLVAGYKTIPVGRRIITDAQVDGLLGRILAPEGAPAEAFKLTTSANESGQRLQQAITDIQGIYAFTSDEISAFRTDF